MNIKKDNNRYLPDAELDIMKTIWKADRPLCTSDIVALLGSKRKWTRATVHVLTGRLCDKGFLETDKSGHVFLYKPLISEDEYKNCEASSFLRRIYDGSAKNMLASLIDSDKLDRNDIDELAEILSGKRGKV